MKGFGFGGFGGFGKGGGKSVEKTTSVAPEKPSGSGLAPSPDIALGSGERPLSVPDSPLIDEIDERALETVAAAKDPAIADEEKKKMEAQRVAIGGEPSTMDASIVSGEKR